MPEKTVSQVVTTCRDALANATAAADRIIAELAKSSDAEFIVAVVDGADFPLDKNAGVAAALARKLADRLDALAALADCRTRLILSRTPVQ